MGSIPDTGTANAEAFEPEQALHVPGRERKPLEGWRGAKK